MYNSFYILSDKKIEKIRKCLQLQKLDLENDKEELLKKIYLEGTNKAFDLPEGVTKIRFYMWIEGQDVDCENGASGGGISFNLGFTTQASE